MQTTHLYFSFGLKALAWVVALAWLYKFLEAARGLPTIPDLTGSEYDRVPEGGPSLTVIVPARNEAVDVGACLESLLAQDYPNLRVIAVDDRSTDATGAIMDSLASTQPGRLWVMHVTELPSGWLGKTHAMALAARRAMAEGSPEYYLFTDADVEFHPEVLRRALAEAAAGGADHFVVLPTTIAKTWGEGMMLAFLQVISLWGVRLWRVADPMARRDALGVGAFNLIRASAYRQLGGFDAMPMEVVEDLTLGRRVKRAGLRQRVAYAPGMVSLHWAAGVSGVVNGMTKNIFAVFRFRPAMLLAAVGWLTLVCVGPVVFLGTTGTRIAGTVALAAVAGLYLLSSRKSRISGWYAALFPVSAGLVVYSMLRSMTITLLRGGVTWRGTFYSLAELRNHCCESR